MLDQVSQMKPVYYNYPDVVKIVVAHTKFMLDQLSFNSMIIAGDDNKFSPYSIDKVSVIQ